MPAATLPLPHQLPVEIACRKGIGHPDTLAEAIAELASIRYTQYCLNTVGAVLPHSFDKVAILGGPALFTDASGGPDRPVRVLFAGAAAPGFAGHPVPLRDLLAKAARDVLSSALPGFDRLALQFHYEITNAATIPAWPARSADPRIGQTDLAGDTAYLASATPSTTDLLARLTESWFAGCPWAGSDIRVTVLRRGADWRITALIPALAGSFNTSDQFHEAAKATADALHTELTDRLPGRINLVCNPPAAAVIPPHLTVSGSAVDFGESGLVGRGNGPSGVRNSAHRAGDEVPFGRSPTGHIAKTGGWLVDQAAAAVARQYGPARVGVLWWQGTRYRDPAAIEVTTTDGDPPGAAQLVADTLTRTDWLPDLLAGHYLPRLDPVPVLLSALEARP